MSARAMKVLGALACLFAAATGHAQTPPAPAAAAAIPAAPDYTRDAAWLCRPGRADACGARAADDNREYVADPRAPVDCFYVYGTVSMDAGYVSDMTAGEEEAKIARLQMAPYVSRCRVFIPVYRQVTLPTLLARIAAGGRGDTMDFSIPVADLRAAWRDYLARDNGGRGIVLIGHSQGAYLVQRMLEEEILPDARQRQRLVSVIMPGHPGVAAPQGRFGTGAASLPICGAKARSGCIVTYALYARKDAAPPLFGRGKDAACVNPAAVGGGAGTLRGWLPEAAGGYTEASATAECVRDEGGAVVRIGWDGHTARSALEQRAVADARMPGFGLHAWDMQIAQGSLLDLIARQSKDWARTRRR